MDNIIAIIAPGEMGSAIGARLVARGDRVLTTLAGRSSASSARAERAGLVPVASEDALVLEADVVLSVVPPGEALALAERLAPALTQSAKKSVYVDCNAVAPKTAERIGAALAGTGCRYVDGGIIGPPPAATGTRTILYVAGPTAHEAERLGCPGFAVRVIEGPIGAASALKMSYAGVTKGFTAIGAAMMLGAARSGCAEALHREMTESQPHLLPWLSRQVPRMFPKAYRFVAEMEEIAAFLDGDPAGADMYRAIARLYERLAAEAEAKTPPPDGELAQLTRFCDELGETQARKRA
jgi:3-hydroxyisobutyrate dehydrogenase-like beta-hydroxyacid dehydrogenase